MIQLSGNLQSLLNAIRELYVIELSAAVHTHNPCHVEPALRRQDGTLAREGTPPTALRMDVITQDSGETVQIDSTRRLCFPRTSAEFNGFNLNIASFFWDAASFRVIGGSPVVVDLISGWFDRWFDSEDQHNPDHTGLHGVVHSLSDIQQSGDDWTFQIDFGSAPVPAFTDLIDTLLRAGAEAVEVS